MEESQHSDQQSFSSDLSNSYHQDTSKGREIESNLVSMHQNSHKRQIDHLYENICEKNLKPKAWLQRAKSDKGLIFRSHHETYASPKAAKLNDQTQKNNKSFQDVIVLSNYKQLLRNNFQAQQEKQQDLHQLQKKYHKQELQSGHLLRENQQLKKQILKLARQKHEQETKVKVLSQDLKKLHRKYDNLLKESEAKQASLNTQMKRLKEEKSSYENLINALKESIHILKGKKVKDLEQIWVQWKQIFQLASLQQCKLSKKANRY